MKIYSKILRQEKDGDNHILSGLSCGHTERRLAMFAQHLGEDTFCVGCAREKSRGIEGSRQLRARIAEAQRRKREGK